MGTTILLGQAMGSQKKELAGGIMGSSICFFVLVALGVTVLMFGITEPFTRLMHAPEEAFSKTMWYVRICSGGTVFIVAYNVLGSIFRGMGDSRTPLMTVACACVFNIAGDLIFVAGLHMETSGAALATVLAQAFSVILCLGIVKKRGLPFPFSRKNKSLTGRSSGGY